MKRYMFVFMAAALSMAAFAQDIKRPESYNYQRGLEAYENENYGEALEYLTKEIGDNAKNGYAYTWLSIIYASQEEYGRALTAVENSLKYLPSKDKNYVYTAYVNRAVIQLGLGDTLKAIKDYTTAIKVQPDESAAYEKRAQIYYQQGKYDLADADYHKIISNDKGSVMGYMGLGRNLNAQKKWAEAIEQFNYVAKLYSDYSSAFAFRAESYIGLSDWNNATDDILSALSIDNNDKAYYLMQELDGAAFAMLKAKMRIQCAKNPNDPRWYFYLGIIHENKKMYKDAIDYYQHANDKDASAAVIERVATCYNGLGQFDMAIGYIDKALDLDTTRLSLFNLRANTLYEAGRIDEAIAGLTDILTTYPEYAMGYYRRGWFKELNGDFNGAIEDQTMSITLEPEYSFAYEARGNVYQKIEKTDLSKADFEKVIELEAEPEDYECVQYAYLGLGNYAKAMEVVDTIIARDTLDAGSYYDAACVYSRMGKHDEAMSYLKKSLEKGFKRFFHMSKDPDLDGLRNRPDFKALVEKYNKHKDDSETDIGYFVVEGNYDEPAEPLKLMGTSGTNSKADRSVDVVEVPFTKDNGSSLCNVKCKINGLPLYFIFDTGASSVSFSQVEATFMVKNGYIDKKDVVGNQYFLDATGNVSVGTVLNLRNVDFGGLKLTNVRASVVQNQRAPLLLGQSVLGRLGKIEIDNQQQVMRITHTK